MRIIIKSPSSQVLNKVVADLLNDRSIQNFVSDKQLTITLAPDAVISEPIRTYDDRESRVLHQDKTKRHFRETQSPRNQQGISEIKDHYEHFYGYEPHCPTHRL